MTGRLARRRFLAGYRRAVADWTLAMGFAEGKMARAHTKRVKRLPKPPPELAAAHAELRDRPATLDLDEAARMLADRRRLVDEAHALGHTAYAEAMAELLAEDWLDYGVCCIEFEQASRRALERLRALDPPLRAALAYRALVDAIERKVRESEHAAHAVQREDWDAAARAIERVAAIDADLAEADAALGRAL